MTHLILYNWSHLLFKKDDFVVVPNRDDDGGTGELYLHAITNNMVVDHRLLNVQLCITVF